MQMQEQEQEVQGDKEQQHPQAEVCCPPFLLPNYIYKRSFTSLSAPEADIMCAQDWQGAATGLKTVVIAIVIIITVVIFSLVFSLVPILVFIILLCLLLFVIIQWQIRSLTRA